jgi:hypothetical protein
MRCRMKNQFEAQRKAIKKEADARARQMMEGGPGSGRKSKGGPRAMHAEFERDMGLLASLDKIHSAVYQRVLANKSNPKKDRALLKKVGVQMDKIKSKWTSPQARGIGQFSK